MKIILNKKPKINKLYDGLKFKIEDDHNTYTIIDVDYSNNMCWVIWDGNTVEVEQRARCDINILEDLFENDPKWKRLD